MDNSKIISKVIESYTRLCNATGMEKDIFLVETIVRRTLDEVEKESKEELTHAIPVPEGLSVESFGKILADRMCNVLEKV